MKTRNILFAIASIVLCSFMLPDWMLFQDAGNNFKVNIPQKPTESEQTVNSEIGDLYMKIFMLDQSEAKDDNLVYGVIYTDYPDSLVSSEFEKEKVNGFFTGAIEGASTNIEGIVLSQEVVSYKKFPGRLVKIQFGEEKMNMYMKMFLVKNRVYILQVICTAKKDKNKSINKFFDSFALVN